ncbi:FMN-binding negative transcriptional regulator [Phenylobacterium sp. LjRoot219]|uniref:FMN-binding negative transcriptional regulator n=1 Tax=Phenylobacterium sp. LjRoot219 TaxID=3342283 RepID=UPI003ED0D65D
MYTPPAFEEARPERLRDLIRGYPLATLVTAGPGGLTANLVPFVLAETEGGDVLRAHMARANDQVASLREAAEALVIFQGPQAYITPSWYETKKVHGRVVPTWNYVVVQVWGKPQLIAEPDWLMAQIDHLTRNQEAGRSEPWAVTDAPESYIASQLHAIVGLEIPVARIEGKWKVSQNQPEPNRQGVIRGLREAAAEDMAAVVADSVRGV